MLIQDNYLEQMNDFEKNFILKMRLLFWNGWHS